MLFKRTFFRFCSLDLFSAGPFFCFAHRTLSVGSFFVGRFFREYTEEAVFFRSIGAEFHKRIALGKKKKKKKKRCLHCLKIKQIRRYILLSAQLWWSSIYYTTLLLTHYFVSLILSKRTKNYYKTYLSIRFQSQLCLTNYMFNPCDRWILGQFKLKRAKRNYKKLS